MGGSDVTESTRNAGRSCFSPRGQEDPLDKGMAPHSRILAWRMPWTGEPGGLQSTGSQGVGHDRATDSCTFYFRKPCRQTTGERKRVDCRLCFLLCVVINSVLNDSARLDWLVLECKTQQLGFAESWVLFFFNCINSLKNALR